MRSRRLCVWSWVIGPLERQFSHGPVLLDLNEQLPTNWCREPIHFRGEFNIVTLLYRIDFLWNFSTIVARIRSIITLRFKVRTSFLPRFWCSCETFALCENILPFILFSSRDTRGKYKYNTNKTINIWLNFVVFSSIYRPYNCFPRNLCIVYE